MAEVTLIKNPAEQQLAAEWAAAKAKLPGAAPLRAAAFEQFARTRTSAPACRGMEIH